MLRQRGTRACLALLILVVVVTAKPPPSFTPWASMYGGKSAYARSLGPPGSPGFSTVSVPFGPKSSPFFPKFVDPKAMISMKTDMLSNLFGGLGPVGYPGAPAGGFSKFGSGTPVLYATGDDEKPKIEPKPEGTVQDENEVAEEKRAIFGSKYGAPGPGFGPFSPSFGPTSKKSKPFGPFGPFGSQFAPSGPFPGAQFSGSYPGMYSASRKRRSIETGAPKDLGPPPAYPGLGTISEEPEDAPTAPKQYLPGMFGPFGPFGPFGGFAPAGASPVIDPSYFIAKKTSFLDTLFSNLATSTPTPTTEVPPAEDPVAPQGPWSPVEAATALPVPKTTIVPPGFWAPSSIIPTPTEYTDKVNFFLNKLFTNIVTKKLANATADPTAPKSARSVSSEPDAEKTVVARSLDDLQTISDAKDAIIDSIIAELGSVKTDMVSNFDDYVAFEKLEATKAALTGKKPMKPIKAAFAGFFGPPPVDTALPFKQKMSVLSQVFDMLTELQKNITTAVTDAVKNNVSEESEEMMPQGFYYPVIAQKPVQPFNMSFLDAIKSKLASLDAPKSPYQPLSYGKFARTISKGPSPFFLPNPKANTMKRHINDQDDDDQEQFKRSVKMSMHQGYQSMPPGTVETVQAGGGSTPDHQGGGINLLIQMPKSNTPGYVMNDDENNYKDWQQYAEWGNWIKDQYKDQKHHHNHH